MKLKSTVSLLTILSLSLLASTFLSMPVKATETDIEFLTHWTEPSEVEYWTNVINEYNEHYAPSGYRVKMTSVEFDILYDTITTRHTGGQDPDIMHIHAMWIPRFANWRSNIISVPPDDVQAQVGAEWTPVTVGGATYKGIIWGYPSEFNSWALVYNKVRLQEAGYSAPPTTWDELKTMAVAMTKKDATGKIIQHGFVPFVEGMPEEQRYQFMSLLWSNGGEYLDLNSPLAPRVLFNGVEGTEVMELYHELGYDLKTYDPNNMPDYWWQAWVDETIGMMILPTWMTYVRDAMPATFDHLAIAPIPIGPHGTESKSATYNWINVVSQRAADDGRANAAWDFLRWINAARPQYDVPLPGAPTIGSVPKGDGVTIMGDYLIRDSIVPSKIQDQTNGRRTIDDGTGHGTAGPLISDDFWFKGFMDIGKPPYGQSDQPFLTTKEVQYEIGQMFEKVTILAGEPAAAVQDAANKIQPLLPMPGDVNIDGNVDIYDAVHMIKDIDATYLSPPQVWVVGRSDVNDDLVVDGADTTILSTNYLRTGGY